MECISHDTAFSLSVNGITFGYETVMSKVYLALYRNKNEKQLISEHEFKTIILIQDSITNGFGIMKCASQTNSQLYVPNDSVENIQKNEQHVENSGISNQKGHHSYIQTKPIHAVVDTHQTMYTSFQPNMYADTNHDMYQSIGQIESDLSIVDIEQNICGSIQQNMCTATDHDMQKSKDKTESDISRLYPFKW